MRNTASVTGSKLNAVWSQSISGVRAINPLVAFYDIHGKYFVPNTTRDLGIEVVINVFPYVYDNVKFISKNKR
jgi:hypothetical protein